MDITRYLHDEIAVATFVSDDNLDGLPTYSAPVVHRARIENGLKTLRNPDGTTVDTTTSVATRATIGPRDRVWFAPDIEPGPRTFSPGPLNLSDNDARSPLVVNHARDRLGTQGHWELFF